MIDDELQRIMDDLKRRSKDPEYKAKYERMEKEKREREIDLLISRSGIPRLYLESTFENFVEREDVEGLGRALKLCQQYVEVWPEMKKGQGMVLCGDIGVGKTHLAVAVARGLISKYLLPVKYANVLLTFEQARWSFDGDDINPIRALTECPFLILDDLGSERPTEWSLSQVSLIVLARTLEARSTIVTSNAATWKGLRKMLTLGVPGGGEAAVQRAFDRLRDMVGDPIVMKGKSYRGRRDRSWMDIPTKVGESIEPG